MSFNLPKSNHYMLALNVSCISESYIEIKINLNFYFHTTLWCLKRFYEGFISLRPRLGREMLSETLRCTVTARA